MALGSGEAAVGSSGGSDNMAMKHQLRGLAASLHKRLFSVASRARSAKSAAAAADARASALAARLRLAGMSDEVEGFPPVAGDGNTRGVDELHAELHHAQREVAQLQTALHDALQRVEAQAAELASLRGAAAAGAVGAVGAANGATSPVTSAGSTPLISAWAPGQPSAAGGTHAANSPRSIAAEPPATDNVLLEVGHAESAPHTESSLRTGATTAGIVAQEGSGHPLEAAQRLGSLSPSIPGWPSESGVHTFSSTAADGAHAPKSSLQLKPVMGADYESAGADSPHGSRAHARLVDNLLDASNEGRCGRSSSTERAAGQGKQTFMGVDLSDIDGSSIGGQESRPPSTRQSSPYALVFCSILSSHDRTCQPELHVMLTG